MANLSNSAGAVFVWLMTRQLASNVNRLVEQAELRRLEDAPLPCPSVPVLSDGTRHSRDRSDCGNQMPNGVRVATVSPAGVVMAAAARSEHRKYHPRPPAASQCRGQWLAARALKNL